MHPLVSKLLTFTRKNILGIAIILIAWLVFFSPLLFGGEVYFLDDLKIIFYPLEQIYAEFQSNWTLPEWSNLFGFGQPLIAWGQLGFFTPLHLLLRAFSVSPPILLQISVTVYLLIGAIGMFTLMRIRKFSTPASTIASALFTFSGFTIGHLNHVNFYTTTMLLPWLLLATHFLITKPTITKAILLTLIASATVMSGQAQVVLYTFIIATIISLAFFIQKHAEEIKKIKTEWRKPARVIGLTLIAGLLAFGLSSTSILPLQEFIPQTERGEDGATTVLYEFSYPPHHAITLILPYFFGNHEQYWGAKGFQELAAFTGIIPLFLAGAALAFWRTKRAERVAGIILITSAILFALGKHSILYSYLIDNHILTSLNIPGRFVFFFDFGIALLAACSIDDIIEMTKTSSKKLRIAVVASGILFPVFLITPFVIYMQSNPGSYNRLAELASTSQTQWLVLIIGLLILPTYFIALKFQKTTIAVQYLLVIATTTTLIIYAYDYNPRVDANIAFKESPSANILREYKNQNDIPARLYSREVLLRGGDNQSPKRTEPISPLFTVHQPMYVGQNGLKCIEIPLQSDEQDMTPITISIKESLEGDPIRSMEVTSENTSTLVNQDVCFEEIPNSADKTYIVTLSSEKESKIVSIYYPTQNEEYKAYFVRKQEPTEKELARSKKTAFVVIKPKYNNIMDNDAALMSRHLQAVADTSGARWIGALYIKEYREFIETFFANDTDPVDGDGIHAIKRHRKILDMTGVSHLMQALPKGLTDTMPDENYNLIKRYDIGEAEIRTYENPQAFPKAFMVQNAIISPAADEIRYEMAQENFDPLKLVFISAKKPPEITQESTQDLDATATITKYEPTQVDVEVQTNEEAFLVVTDSTTEQWQTFIDGKPAKRLVANSVFKSAQVPKGTHTVSFRYESKAIKRAKALTITSLIIIIATLIGTPIYKRLKS